MPLAILYLIWLLMALTGGFAFWPAIMKGIRMTGTDEEQGRMYGIFEALNGLASLLLSFIMIGVMAVVGGSDLITGFKSALAFMGGLSIVSGILVAILMPKDAAYGVSEEEKENAKKDMGEMLDYIDKLNELDTTGIEPMSHVFPVHNVFREDVVKPSLPTEEILKNAPEQGEDHFLVRNHA